jgi:predicted RNase H-like nuclease (RuvC/YqgF family)
MLINVKGGTMKEDPSIERLKQQNEKLEREIRETKELIERLLREKGEKR